MLLWCLLIALVLRWLLHAAYLPVFEGPDEPFHLARARQVAFALRGDATWPEAMAGRLVDPALLAAMGRSPCGADMERAYGCPSWSGDAEFNVLRPPGAKAGVDSEAPSGREDNYQAHQPPLYYLGAGSVLALADGADVRTQILLLRLVAAALCGAGVWVLLPALGPRTRLVFVACLWLPGATESLIRVANDGPVFLWAAVVLRSLLGATPAWPRARAAMFLALGPLLKLTALPIVALVAVDRLCTRRWRDGLVLAVAGAVVLPLQWLRGWAWGGTLEADAGLVPVDPWSVVIVGVAHSAYTFVKTAVWLGGWSVFRPPAWLLLLLGGLLAWWLTALRPRSDARRPIPHGVAVAVAAVGFLAFAIGKRQLFGVWGAVGGWYAWAWWPWLCVMGQDLLEAREIARPRRALVVASILGLVAANAAWWWVAHQIYGL